MSQSHPGVPPGNIGPTVLFFVIVVIFLLACLHAEGLL